MKILITGCRGQLGTELQKQLAAESCVLGPLPERLRKATIIPVDVDELDITDREATINYIRRHQPETVINCAAFTNVDGCEISRDAAYKVNALGPRNLALACEKVNARLIHVSTDYVFPGVANGGIALAQIAQHYLGGAGLLILAATVTLACLKTAVGLITSCSETFSGLFPKGPGYKTWAVIFTLVSLLFSNLGLSAIIGYSVPVLMFLYPLSITLILLSLTGRFFGHDRAVYLSVTAFTLVGAVYDLLRTLPDGVRAACHLDGFLAAVKEILPLAELGLGWVCPALLGLAIGLGIHCFRGKKQQEK